MSIFSSAVVGGAGMAVRLTVEMLRLHKKVAGGLLTKAALFMVLYPEIADAVVTVCNNYVCDSSALHGGVNVMSNGKAYENSFCQMLKNSGVPCNERSKPDQFSFSHGI